MAGMLVVMLAEEGSCGAGAAGLDAEIAARVPAGASGKVGAKGRPRKAPAPSRCR